MKRNRKTEKRDSAYAKGLYEFPTDYYECPKTRKYPHGVMQAIIDFLVNSGEIPTDYYYDMQIPAGTFRSAVSVMMRNKIIRKVFREGVHTYVLQSRVRSLYQAYITPNVTLPSRARMTMLASLNAFLDAQGVSVFLRENPPAENIAVDIKDDLLHFHNSYHLKKAVTDYPESIQRSKCFGLITKEYDHYMVYYENRARDFFAEEDLFRMDVSRYIGKEIKDALLFVDCPDKAAYWIHYFMAFSEYFSGENPCKYFESLRVVIIDPEVNREVEENFKTVFMEEDILCQLEDHYGYYEEASQWDYDEQSVVIDGVKNYVVLTLNIPRVVRILRMAEMNPDEDYAIVCSPTAFKVLLPLVRDDHIHIQVYVYREEFWCRMMQDI